MATKITFVNPDMPDGKEYWVKNLGLLVNNKQVEFSDEEVAAFEEATGKTLKEAFPTAKFSAPKGGDD
jgi:hypothetical protein